MAAFKIPLALLVAACLLLTSAQAAPKPAPQLQTTTGSHESTAAASLTTLAAESDTSSLNTSSQTPALSSILSGLTSSKGELPQTSASSAPVSKSTLSQAEPSESEAAPKEEEEAPSKSDSEQPEEAEASSGGDVVLDLKKKFKDKFKKKGFELEMLAEKLEFLKSDEFKMTKLRGLEDLIKFILAVVVPDVVKTFLPHKFGKRGKRPLWDKFREPSSRYQQQGGSDASMDETIEHRPSRTRPQASQPARRRRRPRRRPKIIAAEEAELEPLEGPQAEAPLYRDPKVALFEKFIAKESEMGPIQQGAGRGPQQAQDSMLEMHSLESALQLLYQLKMAKMGASRRQLVEPEESDQQPPDASESATSSESDSPIWREDSKRSETSKPTGTSGDSSEPETREKRDQEPAESSQSSSARAN